jgi:hypothetical protein
LLRLPPLLPQRGQGMYVFVLIPKRYTLVSGCKIDIAPRNVEMKYQASMVKSVLGSNPEDLAQM